MKIGLARIYTKNSNLSYNFKTIEKFYNLACDRELTMVIFPRLALTGFPSDDKFLSTNFLKKVNDYTEKIIELTSGRSTRIILGNVFTENGHNSEKILIRDAAFFIGDGYVDELICRKEIAKDNPLDDYRYFDRNTYLKYFECEKKKFALLLSDDIFSNFNVLLVSDNKPDYIICLDSSTGKKNIEKQLLKLAKFSKVPLFYMNSSSYMNGNIFDGRIILLNEDFQISMDSIYGADEIVEFEIDCDDGSELLLREQPIYSLSILPILRKYFNRRKPVINVDTLEKNQYKFADECECVTFSARRANRNIKMIDIGDFINRKLFNGLNSKEKNLIISGIMDMLNKK